MTEAEAHPNGEHEQPGTATGHLTDQGPTRMELSVQADGDATRLVLSGALATSSLPDAEQQLRRETAKAGQGGIVFDLGKVSRLDTAGALVLNLIRDELARSGRNVSFAGASDQQQDLLQKSVIPEEKDGKGHTRAKGIIRRLAGIGKAVTAAGELAVGLTGFLGHFLVTLFSLVRQPSRMRWTSLVFQMEQVGLRAVPIVSLLTFLIGLVVAYMGAQQLSMFGADIFAVNLLEVTVLREMAVLITAIVVAGRSSSSFTAQIGAMVANEEVAALRSMGLDPNALLVVPRVLALIVTLPMLVFIADIMALAGGAVAIRFTIDISFTAFLTQFSDVAKLNNFLVGLIKTPFFAVAIGVVGCFQGFRATGSAESVGFLTTVSVVQSIFIVIVVDALFAIFFSNIGM